MTEKHNGAIVNTITYDAQGNPTSYLGHTLTWEKGRQLKKFDGNIYTYNANGIRTSKIINGVKRAYTLDGTKILRETWGNNTLIPLYDNEDSVCGIVYNDEPYYFQKNLKGDVIALISKDTKSVARYTYDSWGVCTVTMDVLGAAKVNRIGIGGTTLTARRDSIMYPTVITILRSVGSSVLIQQIS